MNSSSNVQVVRPTIMAYLKPCILCDLFLILLFANLSYGSIKKGLCVGPKTHMCDDFKVWHNINWW